MMPHPTTMSFAWEKDVQRCSRILVCVFVLAVIALLGSADVLNRLHDATPTVAEKQPPLVTEFSAAGISGDAERRVVSTAESTLLLGAAFDDAAGS